MTLGNPVTPDTVAMVQEVIRVVDAIDAAVDAKDWPAARTLFADQVLADFSSLSGQPAATVSGDAIIDGWAANLKPAKTSFHLRGNHRVQLDGESATVWSHGYAWNRMIGNGDPLWEVWGDYEHGLERRDGQWRVVAMRFSMTHERGNLWVKTTVPDR